MPAPVAESMLRRTPKVQAAMEVAKKQPQPPVSPENGEQFARPSAEKAGISRVDPVAGERISRHGAASGGELIAPQSEDGADELVTRAIRKRQTCAAPGRSGSRMSFLGGSEGPGPCTWREAAQFDSRAISRRKMFLQRISPPWVWSWIGPVAGSGWSFSK